MLISTSNLKYGYAALTDYGAYVNFRDKNNATLLLSADDPDDLVTALRRAADAIETQLTERDASELAEAIAEPKPEPKPEPEEIAKPGEPSWVTDRRARSVDIEDVNTGDQIRIGGWWHRVAEINERRHGVTVKTTRNEWFAFDHGDRVTVAGGGDND